MKRGLLGGSFDPIHQGHLLLAEQAREFFSLDQVIFLPAKLPPHKQQQSLRNASIRCQMVQWAIEDHPLFQASDLELSREGPSYTIDTIQALQARYPEDEWYFLCGADSIFQLETWKNFELLLRSVIFVGANRPGFSEEALIRRIQELNLRYDADIRHLPMPWMDLSSREIREQLKEGRSGRYLIPEVVRQYIMKTGLYHED